MIVRRILDASAQLLPTTPRREIDERRRVWWRPTIGERAIVVAEYFANLPMTLVNGCR